MWSDDSGTLGMEKYLIPVDQSPMKKAMVGLSSLGACREPVNVQSWISLVSSLFEITRAESCSECRWSCGTRTFGFVNFPVLTSWWQLSEA